MILRILVLAFAALLPLSMGKMDMNDFSAKFEDMCFQNEDSDPFLVNGQETPLSNTLENFISMAEKFEVANPTVDLKDELAYFISGYLFEGITYANGKIIPWTPGRAKFDVIDSLWDPDIGTYTPHFEEPFTDAEKCSIYYMISHSILSKNEAVMRSSRNFSFDRVLKSELQPDDYYPQEIGVVAIRGTDAAVSLSKVLLGLYVGVKNNRISDLSDYDVIHVIPEEKLPQDKKVDSLYAVTLAEIVFLSAWSGSNRMGLAKNGNWVSIPLGNDVKIDGFCPMVYKQEVINGKLPAYSYSSVRGAADGLILGLIVNQVYSKKSDTKLSQILRMYYSPRGIKVDPKVEDINENYVSFCSREAIIQPLESKINDQMLKYAYLIANKYQDVEKDYNVAKTNYSRESKTIFQNTNTEILDYCAPSASVEKPEEMLTETFLDVIVVMDSSSLEKVFQEQQLIVGYLAKQLDLRYTGSRMTVLLDQKLNFPSGTSSKIELKPIVDETFSSSCAACIVGQIGYETSQLARDEVVVAIDQYLEELKNNETGYNGVNGKAVIFFNYENENGRASNNKIQGSVDSALRNFYKRHLDISFYAVGLDSEVLKKYARNDPSLIFLGTEDKPEVIADKIFQKLSYAPALLQYSDCKDARNEKSAIYESFVSPNKMQHYIMPAEYFYKSFTLKVLFESQNGLIRVCHNRATRKPENEAKYCRETTANTGVEFKLSNPCKGLTKETCPPFYFAVMGLDAVEENGNSNGRMKDYCSKTNDHWCSTLDQIKFKVSHEGVRCSGCLGLGAPSAVILFAVLLSYFFFKRF